VLRIIHPQEVLGLQMLLVALIGLSVNLASIALLRRTRRDDINVRSVFYHMVADAASSVGIVGAAVVIIYTGWNILDPLVSLGISALIVRWSWGILRDSTKILLEIAPTGLNIDIVTEDLKGEFPELRRLYNRHLWTITAGMVVFSAHAELGDLPDSVQPRMVIARMNDYLAHKYGFIESTIQVGGVGEAEVCELP
jgi:cobalt-zinc-cadmium efflux system protein